MKLFFDVDDSYVTQALQTITDLFGDNSQVSVLSKLERMKQASQQSVIFFVLGGGLS